MDRISDSGSDGCGSIPHGGTRKAQVFLSFSCTPYPNPSQLRRQPLSGACRLPLKLQSGVPAASMFCEHLADADDAALMRLVIVFGIALSLFFYLHQCSSQRKYSLCQRRAFCGLSIQWFSSGKMSSLDGTPIICAALYAAIPSSTGTL